MSVIATDSGCYQETLQPSALKKHSNQIPQISNLACQLYVAMESMLAICVVNTFDELQLPLILYQPMTSCLDMVVKLVTSQNIVSYMDGSLIIAIPIILGANFFSEVLSSWLHKIGKALPI